MIMYICNDMYIKFKVVKLNQKKEKEEPEWFKKYRETVKQKNETNRISRLEELSR